ncbi:MAG TPA: hypothetical protein VHS03_12465, partial [Gaiellaceae bacterium]|nr:hypothetical protein [Gaiellaceae bacterium]
DAMCWGPVHLAELQQVIGGGTVRVAEPRRLRDGLGMVSYSRYNADDGLAGHELDHALVTGAIGQATRGPVFREGSNLSFHVHGDVWAWLGRGDWLYGTPVEHRELPYTDSAFASIAEDRRRLAALWLLMTQPGIASVETSHGTRAERRRAERHGAATPTVQIIDVARRHTRTHANGDGEHRHVNVRYLVSGHWRRQAYGPHRAYRRPTWIAAHWRGPEDAPLSNVEHVRVLDTGEHR